jgi:hypothetical protein
MKTAVLAIATLAAGITARGDFSYTTTMKSPGGAPAMLPGAGGTSKHYLKGQKMKVDHGNTSTIIDMDAQTITSVNNTDKTYVVRKFSDMSELSDKMAKSGTEVSVDVKDTGRQQNISGYNAHEVIMTMVMDNAEARAKGMKMAFEMTMWISKDVPGSQEAVAFYKRNAGRFPWSAMMGGAGSNPSMQKSMSTLMSKMASFDGVPVMQITKMKPIGMEAQMAQAQGQMAQARAKLEEQVRKGGQQAAMAQQALAMMDRQAGGSLFEIASESSNFSTASIPDGVFAIPGGYQQKAAN